MALSLRGVLGLGRVTKRKSARLKKGLRFEALESRLALSTLTVGADGKDDFHTIQDAVNAAHSGDTIKVDPGTYVEQVTVGAGKDNLKLVGTSQNAIIQAPTVMTGNKAIVDIDGSQNVTIEKFTIEGPGGGGCDSIEYGIRVNGSANINDNHITHIRDIPAPGDQVSGCQNGVGILVGRASESIVGQATISRNTIDDYQKGGIVVSNSGSSAQIKDNTVVGVGPTDDIAQNGIQVSGGATANVNHNTVSNNIYTLQSVVSTGILLFDAGKVSISNNKLFANDISVYADGVGAGSSIDHNSISNNTFDGIDLYDSTGVLISDNTSTDNGYDGIYVDVSAAGNTLKNNKLKNNAVFDAEDASTGSGTAGTGNTWKNNKGKTSNPSGLVS